MSEQGEEHTFGDIFLTLNKFQLNKQNFLMKKLPT